MNALAQKYREYWMPSGGHPKINPVFDDFLTDLEPFLPSQVCKPYDPSIKLGLQSDLCESITAHISEHNDLPEDNDVVVLTHPFYLAMGHPGYLNVHETQHVAYIDKVFELLAEHKELGINVVAFETPRHYPGLTSILNEEGLIDQVFLTVWNNGYLENNAEMQYFKNKTVYVGGGYDGECLKGTILGKAKRRFFKTGLAMISTVCGLPEITVSSPLGKTTVVDQVEHLDPDKNILLRTLYSQLISERA